ncbi:hypothetical protein M378DRAFT_164583 [Amanita muscaria Koide BX008]|uniref:Uncharacterized protein n=1 Tax=Amanita muscaria (strain Koide BX008) TaxID=946122 RepID=A0A0C2SJ97_AMAMK|nr:hypothetical protein M378DRAFT_164583 [Amanita muscaria Koide BX008]
MNTKEGLYSRKIGSETSSSKVKAARLLQKSTTPYLPPLRVARCWKIPSASSRGRGCAIDI